ncbi:MAG: thioredoxin family protein [Promethearchaeota archaeon]
MMDAVNVKVFVRDERKCPFCPDALSLVNLDTKNLSNELKINLEVIDLDQNPELAEKYNISGVPTILIGDNIKYVGLPVGLERRVFTNTLKLVAGGGKGTRVTQEQKTKLTGIKDPATVKVITTSSCPYCPKVVFMSNQLAVASEGKVTSEIINSTELPELAVKYRVSAVPTTIINEKVRFQGIPELDAFVEEIARKPPVLSYYI